MPVLRPFDMPLDGISLIEASAGTGKTYNITRLYLRLLLERKLTVEQILVVTFTKAATEELRDRIRARIQEVMKFLEKDKASIKDKELKAWLKARANTGDDLRVLRVALTSMDSAAVFTIHGFCQRVLTENAFDTGAAFELEFIENEDDLILAAAEDFWRKFFADPTLPRQVVDSLLQACGSPDVLVDKISSKLNADLQLLPKTAGLRELLGSLPAFILQLNAVHQKVKQCWEDEHEQVVEILQKSPALNRKSYNGSAVEKALNAVQEIVDASQPILTAFEKQELLTASLLAEKTKKNQETPQNPFFDESESYHRLIEEGMAKLRMIEVAFFVEARQYIQRHLRTAKEANQQLYFDDLLSHLDTALSGKGGDLLAGKLREQYPFALIDEFQDTDQTQYRIFHAIYGKQMKDKGLCLIGDPKQAIYGFRGGDIYTYLKAAKDASQRHSLDTNWRSSSRLVEAVNTLFMENERPFLEPGIEYQPVKASDGADEEPLRIDGKVPVPLQFWRLLQQEDNTWQGRIKVDWAKETAALACARHINQLLQPGRATLGEAPLKAADIAILVRTHKDATLMQDALREQGINSVTLSQQSVFATDEAGSLLHLLQALLDCEDESLLRYVLADRLLGYDAETIQALLRDDDAWEKLQQRFFEYRETWRRKGFIQAFQQLFKAEGIARRLLTLPDGERRLTNLLHLVELLQQAARSRSGMEALLRWLADEINLAGKHEEALLRLESDENLVKVVTMHSSKGLEYPVVYVPFAWAEGDNKKKLPLFFHDDQGQACLYFGGADEALEKEAKARFDYESLAERLRLLYVSLTRAAKLLVLPWGKVNNADKSALAWLLYPGENDRSAMGKMSEDAIFQRLETLADAASHAIEVRELPGSTASAASATSRDADLQARPFAATILRNWWVNSYSGLVRGANSEQPDVDAVTDEEQALPASGSPVQALPAGARFGLAVHELLEHLDFTNVDEEALKAQVQRLSWKHGVPPLRKEKGLQAMASMIRNVLDTELPGAGLKLADLSREHRVDEMEFHFSTATLGPRKLASFLAEFPAWQGAADGLGFHPFQGLMHGFIDLVFFHDGRYWLADYKSNRLEDYGPQGLEEAMAAHHYPLQALIYSLALHRYLRQRLPDYDPPRHFGGVFYLFTRGMRPGSEAGIWQRPVEVDLLEALDAHFSGRAVA